MKIAPDLLPALHLCIEVAEVTEQLTALISRDWQAIKTDSRLAPFVTLAPNTQLGARLVQRLDALLKDAAKVVVPVLDEMAGGEFVQTPLASYESWHVAVLERGSDLLSLVCQADTAAGSVPPDRVFAFQRGWEITAEMIERDWAGIVGAVGEFVPCDPCAVLRNELTIEAGEATELRDLMVTLPEVVDVTQIATMAEGRRNARTYRRWLQDAGVSPANACGLQRWKTRDVVKVLKAKGKIKRG